MSKPKTIQCSVCHEKTDSINVTVEEEFLQRHVTEHGEGTFLIGDPNPFYEK